MRVQRPRRVVEAQRPTLAEEVAVLDSARKALTAGNTTIALDALAGHEQRFAAGALAAEASVLRIEALAARGDHAGAAARARAFLSTYPNDPHADHVRSLLGDQEAKARGEKPDAPKH
jgi:outer membrane protein assembly factor BamD (BamD/ComL family)